MKKPRLVVVGRSKTAIEKIEAGLAPLRDQIAVENRLVVNGFMDPLHGIEPLPDALVLVLSAHAVDELAALGMRPPYARTETLVISAESGTDLMRMAMKAGARDFFAEPFAPDELIEAVRQILSEHALGQKQTRGSVTAVINAKGGSGATFIAGNLAHLLRIRGAQSVALVDFDFQFPSLGLNLDIKPDLNLIGALESVEHLDTLAIEGYMVRHSSGVSLLTPPTGDIVLVGEVQADNVKRLLKILADGYTQVICDLPRQIDSVNAVVLEQADNIVIVLQQSLAHIRDAKRLIKIMRAELDIEEERIKVVLNRHTSREPLGLWDVERALELGSPLFSLHNDHENVNTSTNLGVPIYEYAPKAAVTKSLIALAESVSGIRLQPPRKGFFRRTVARLHA